MSSDAAGPGTQAGSGAGPVVLGVLSGLGHLLPGFFIAASGLIAPLWAVLAMVVGWLAAAALLVVLVRRRSWWSPAVPLLTLGSWFAVISLGEQYGGWTA